MRTLQESPFWFAVVLLGFFVGAGCFGTKDSLVGRWSSGRGTTYEFDASGHVKRTDEFQGTVAIYEGVYALKDDYLTVTVKSGTSVVSKTKEAAEQLVKAYPTTHFTLRWLGPDAVEFKGDLSAVTFKRA